MTEPKTKAEVVSLSENILASASKTQTVVVTNYSTVGMFLLGFYP